MKALWSHIFSFITFFFLLLHLMCNKPYALHFMVSHQILHKLRNQPVSSLCVHNKSSFHQNAYMCFVMSQQKLCPLYPCVQCHVVRTKGAEFALQSCGAHFIICFPSIQSQDTPIVPVFF